MDKIMIFIPMYNCENQIVRVLKQLNSDICEYISEVVVINNISTDNGEKKVINYLRNNKINIKVSLLRNDRNYGLGGSHKVAFNYAIEKNYDYVIVLHGDDQGDIKDIVPYLKSKEYQNYDCLLGARFMKNSRIVNYSKLRIFGNKVFNLLFSICLHQKIYDLGSGLNMYKVSSLKDKYYLKLPDTLYFNDCMLLMHKYKNMDMKFFPISWREEDQVSNNKLISFSKSLLKMLYQYCFHKEKYLNSDMRKEKIDEYSAKVVEIERRA